MANKYKRMSDGAYFAAQDEFMKRYNAPRCEPIHKLDLLLKREFAEAMIRGEKKVEIRSFNDHYFDCLTDMNVDRWMTEHRDSFGMDMEAFNEFMCATRPVLNIHFHDEKSTWYLDVSCTENALVGLTRKNVDELFCRFNFGELHMKLAQLEQRGVPEEERPLFYYFVIGAVLDTNLVETKTGFEITSQTIALKSLSNQSPTKFSPSHAYSVISKKSVALKILTGQLKHIYHQSSNLSENKKRKEVFIHNQNRSWYVRVECASIHKSQDRNGRWKLDLGNVIETNLKTDMEYVEFEFDNNDPNIRRRWLLRKALILRKYAGKFPRKTDKIRMKFGEPANGWLPITFYKNKTKMGTFVASDCYSEPFAPLKEWLESVAKSYNQASVVKLNCERSEVVFSYEPMWFYGKEDYHDKYPHPANCGIFTVFSNDDGGQFLIEAFCEATVLANELYTEVMDFAWRMKNLPYEPYVYRWNVNDGGDIPIECYDDAGNELPCAWDYFMKSFHSDILSDLRAEKREIRQSPPEGED